MAMKPSYTTSWDTISTSVVKIKSEGGYANTEVISALLASRLLLFSTSSRSNRALRV